MICVVNSDTCAMRSWYAKHKLSSVLNDHKILLIHVADPMNPSSYLTRIQVITNYRDAVPWTEGKVAYISLPWRRKLRQHPLSDLFRQFSSWSWRTCCDMNCSIIVQCNLQLTSTRKISRLWVHFSARDVLDISQGHCKKAVLWKSITILNERSKEQAIHRPPLWHSLWSMHPNHTHPILASQMAPMSTNKSQERKPGMSVSEEKIATKRANRDVVNTVHGLEDYNQTLAHFINCLEECIKHFERSQKTNSPRKKGSLERTDLNTHMTQRFRELWSVMWASARTSNDDRMVQVRLRIKNCKDQLPSLHEEDAMMKIHDWMILQAEFLRDKVNVVERSGT